MPSEHPVASATFMYVKNTSVADVKGVVPLAMAPGEALLTVFFGGETKLVRLEAGLPQVKQFRIGRKIRCRSFARGPKFARRAARRPE
jgi:hypothetical protein